MNHQRGARGGTWTKHPHEYEEALATIAAPAAHRRVLGVLARETWGYHVNSAPISSRFISDATGIDARRVRRLLDDLVDWRVVIRRGGGRGRVAAYGIAPPDRWRVGMTREAVARRERRIENLPRQLELGLEGVGEVWMLPPSRPSPSTRDRVTWANRGGWTSTQVERVAHPITKEERKCVSDAPPADGLDHWDDTDTHTATLRRRLPQLGHHVPEDLRTRVERALAHGRGRGRIRAEWTPHGYAERWILDDIAAGKTRPTSLRRTNEDEPVAHASERQQPPTRTAEERRLNAAASRLRWRSGRFLPVDHPEVVALAASFTEADVREIEDERHRRVDGRKYREQRERAIDAGRADNRQRGRKQ